MLPKTPKIKREKTAYEALASLMRLCARAERSSGDALRLMQNWGVSKNEQQEVLQRLINERFIDDRRYAEAFVREKIQLSAVVILYFPHALNCIFSLTKASA